MQIHKKLAAKMPHRLQTELKRIHFRRQINKARFLPDEPEYGLLSDLLQSGDWVIDVGANVGHYTKRFSELVGPRGRVLAFEPVPTTFSLLAGNVELFSHPNVSLMNAAISDKLDVVGMEMPKFDTGLTNFYEAHLISSEESDLSVLTLSLDSLNIDRKVALVKIDAEGHEAFVLSGMEKLIQSSLPTLIVETGSKELIQRIEAMGYDSERLQDSPNYLFRAKR